MVMRVASFFPFQTTYYLNGHSFIEQELKRAQIGFRQGSTADFRRIPVKRFKTFTALYAPVQSRILLNASLRRASLGGRGNIDDQLGQADSDRAGASFLTGLAWPIRGIATPPISDVAGEVWSVRCGPVRLR
jgi:hypothetical protein